MDEGARFDVEELLANQGWVRSLALRLVGDADLADDIVQQTWIAALENPPRSQDTLRGWLSSVVRRLSARAHRDRYLRRKHDLRVVPPEPLAGPAELLELAERQQRIVALVLELEEPYRSTILRRYFLDWTPEEIARRTGLPAPTVRTHLRRALLRLRERLDRENGGDRAKWVRALLPLAAIPAARRSASAAAGALPSALGTSLGWLVVMMTSVKIALPVALVAGAALLFITRPWQERALDGGRPAIAREDGSSTDVEPSAGAALPATAPSDADERPLIRGRLLDLKTGEPIAAFPVEIRRAEVDTPLDPGEPAAAPARVVTDARGGFRFGDLASGKYRIAPGTDERIELRTEPATVVIDGEHTLEVTLSCEVRYFVAGAMVVSGSGEPVPECWLQVVAQDGTVVAWGATDEEGHFRLADSVPGAPARICATGAEVQWLHSEASEPGSSAKLPLRDIAPGNEDVTQLRVEHPWIGVLEGIVLSGDGHPIEGAKVRVISGHIVFDLWEAFWSYLSYSITKNAPERVTGADGRFRFDRLPSDRTLRLAAVSRGMAPHLGESSRLTSGYRHEIVRLVAPGILRGIVRLPDGTPVAGAMIYAHPPGGGPGHGAMFHDNSRYSDSLLFRHRSDPEGRFELPVAPGRYRYGARSPHHLQPEGSWETQLTEVASGETVELAIELLPGGELEMSGRVVDGDSAPLAGIHIELVKTESSHTVRTVVFTQSDNEGRFRFVNLSEGLYSVIVSDALEPPWYPLGIQSESPTLPAGSNDLTIIHDPERCRLELRVLDAETGDPLNAYLYCGPPDDAGAFQFSTGMATESDGRRSLLLPPGPFDILVDAAGHEPHLERLDLEPDAIDAPPRSLEIRLSRGRAAYGVVVDARGRPVPDAKVGVVIETSARPELLRNSVVTAGEDGAFTIAGLPEHGGRIAAVRRLSIVAGTVTDADRDPIRIVLPDAPEENGGE